MKKSTPATLRFIRERPFLLVCLFIGGLVYLGAFLRLHSKVQITLTGYEIGRLKEREANLLKQKSLLTMELAKLSTKDSLLKRISKKTTVESPKDVKK